MVETLQAQGVVVDGSHHKVACGQHKIDIAFQPALDAADAVVLLRDVVRVVAGNHGLRASFMPKPIDGANGSGMHTHQGLCERDGGATSSTRPPATTGCRRWPGKFVAGQLDHAAALAAVTACTVNSYKRLVAGFEAPTHVSWASSSRGALIRVPRVNRAEALATRIELRCPEPRPEPVPGLRRHAHRGMDGVERRLAPPPALEDEGAGAIPGPPSVTTSAPCPARSPRPSTP